MSKIIVVCFLLFGFCSNAFAEDVDLGCYDEVKQMSFEGSRYMQMGNYENAIQAFKQGLELLKKCSAVLEQEREDVRALYLSTYLGLSGGYLSLGDYQEAIVICEEGKQAIPEFAWSFNDMIAAIYASQGEYQKAIDVCKDTLQSFPDSYTTYIGLGRIYIALKDYNNAKENLEKAADISMKKGDKQVNQEAVRLLGLIP